MRALVSGAACDPQRGGSFDSGSVKNSAHLRSLTSFQFPMVEGYEHFDMNLLNVQQIQPVEHTCACFAFLKRSLLF